MPADAAALAEAAVARLPQIQLPALLIEVDRDTRFTEALSHAGGAQPRNPDLARNLYASVLAHACNLGYAGMADASGISEDSLTWTAQWYLRQETLREGPDSLRCYGNPGNASSRWWGVRGGTRRATHGCVEWRLTGGGACRTPPAIVVAAHLSTGGGVEVAQSLRSGRPVTGAEPGLDTAAHEEVPRRHHQEFVCRGPAAPRTGQTRQRPR